VEVNQYADDVKYGYNLQTITFTASNGSALIYSITRRRDSMSLDEITNYVYVSERNSLNDPEDIINTTTEDHGKVIVSGWDDMRHDRAVYDLLKTTDEYVLQMTVYFPDYTSEEDRLEKAYVTECLYRLCGFSGSSKPTRSYADFLEENQE
jgi:hypothetical protein